MLKPPGDKAPGERDPGKGRKAGRVKELVLMPAEPTGDFAAQEPTGRGAEAFGAGRPVELAGGWGGCRKEFCRAVSMLLAVECTEL